MATITKRMTKSGPSYRIQVKMKDKGSGKLNVYSTTWRPPAGLTQKQMEREVVIYADKYEAELKMSRYHLGRICELVAGAEKG